jgi:hypothetical protein
MPRVKVKPASAAEAAEAPREFSLLVQLAGKDGEAPREVRARPTDAGRSV